MDNVFQFRDQLIERYGSFSRSFVRIAAPDIQAEVEHQYAQGRYWPEPLVQINPNYQRQGTVQNLAAQGVLHAACAEIFQVGKSEGSPEPLHLYKHQMEALAKGQERQSYVVTTGTGSGKSLSFFIPIIDRILKAKQSDGEARISACCPTSTSRITNTSTAAMRMRSSCWSRWPMLRYSLWNAARPPLQRRSWQTSHSTPGCPRSARQGPCNLMRSTCPSTMA